MRRRWIYLIVSLVVATSAIVTFMFLRKPADETIAAGKLTSEEAKQKLSEFTTTPIEKFVGPHVEEFPHSKQYVFAYSTPDHELKEEIRVNVDTGFVERAVFWDNYRALPVKTEESEARKTAEDYVKEHYRGFEDKNMVQVYAGLKATHGAKWYVYEWREFEGSVGLSGHIELSISPYSGKIFQYSASYSKLTDKAVAKEPKISKEEAIEIAKDKVAKDYKDDHFFKKAEKYRGEKINLEDELEVHEVRLCTCYDKEENFRPMWAIWLVWKTEIDKYGRGLTIISDGVSIDPETGEILEPFIPDPTK